MISKTLKQANTCQICNDLAPDFDTASLEIEIPSQSKQNGLATEEVLETLMVILKHVYTGDDTVQIQRYNAHSDSGLQSRSVTEYHIDAAMSPFDISATSSRVETNAQVDDEHEDTTSTPSLSLIAKRIVLLAHETAESDTSMTAFDRTFQEQSFCCVSRDEKSLHILFHYQRTQHYHNAISHLADTMEKMGKSVLPNWNSPVDTVSILGPLNYATIANSIQPSVERTECCIHDIIVRQAKEQPDSIAVDAWDGSFTYAEVFDHAVRLAEKLIRMGVRLEDRVPICMNKSRWVTAAMFGVMLAGATCVPFDVRAPRQRVETLIEKTLAKTVILDHRNLDTFETLPLRAILYPAAETDEDQAPVKLPTVDPSSVAFIYFTSGSTGVPKGVVDEHRDFYVNIQALVKAFSLDRHSRMFQYASYVFDVSTGDTFAVFMAGGCLCIPSEEQRLSEPSAALNSLRATHACLTNTIISQISPTDVPSLQYLFVAGEALDKAQFTRWKDFVSFNVAYGTTETIVVDSLTTSTELLLDPKNLGRTTIGTCMWIVNPEDPEQLRPVGAYGEILIEGPSLGRCYMNEPELTAKKFIDAPMWLQVLRPNEKIRAYRTGDMGFYNSNGSITFAGRADTQVKLRGQRVELLEIESTIRRILPSQGQIIVEAVIIASRGDTKILAACLTNPTYGHSEDLVLPLTSAIRAQFLQIQHELSQILPQYMIPPLFIPFSKFPRTVTGKLDRKTLKQLIVFISSSDIAQYYLTSSPVHQPATEAQRWLQPVWAAVLSLPEESIDIEDHFFQAGGDSVKAMQLIATLRERDIQITADKVFRHPKFDEIAAALTVTKLDVEVSKYGSFEMIRPIANVELCIQEVAEACGVMGDAVVDVYPASPIQEALMATSANRPDLYRQQHVLRAPTSINLDRLRLAIEAVISAESILRTRIVHLQTIGTVQTVIRTNEIIWDTKSTINQRMAHDWSHKMTYGDSLCRFSMIEEGQQWYLVWTAHHSIYDAWSRDLMYEAIHQAYANGDPHSHIPYDRFIKYVMQENAVEGMVEFWRNEFPDMIDKFPHVPSSYTPYPAQHQLLDFIVPRKPKSRFTTATLVQAAWAIVIARQAGTSDALFGLPLSGRDVPVLGITRMIGPTLTTVPVRLNIDNTMSVSQYLQYVQQKTSQIRHYQYYGLQRIRQLSAEAQDACAFHNLLVIQPEQEDELPGLSELGLQTVSLKETDTMDMPLTLQCTMTTAGHLVVKAQHDEKILAPQYLECILHQLKHFVMQLAEESELTSVYDLNLISSHDLERYSLWYPKEPKTVAATLHDMFKSKVLSTPDATAISGFDGDHTYKEIDSMSDRLAYHLLNLGVECESNVVLAFTKSMWPIIAMLAVLKCGGSCCSVNPDHPESRILEICKDVKTKFILCDENYVSQFMSDVEHVVAVNSSLLQDFKPCPDVDFPVVRPNNAAFIVYTSGSTGKPKGSILEHHNLCTSLSAIGEKADMNSSTRTLQFSAYTFDAHILEIFGTLIHGGCVCVISDREKMNELEDVIHQRQMNWSLLTPTVARLLSPAKVPSLKTLILSGEPLAQRDLDQWVENLRLLNGLGPSECSILACITDTLTPTSLASNIGVPIGCHAWITDRRRPDRLVPLGCVGELVLEGPILGRGYINRPKATAAAFVKDLAWSQKEPGRSRRFYRTGDLARLNHDGSIIFVGRADTQVKIRGQRVELEEIEHNIKACEPMIKQLAVEVVKIASRGDTQVLAAFFTDGTTTQSPTETGLIPGLNSGLKDRLADLQKSLKGVLPLYMIPSMFLPVRRLPVSTSGKLERKTLQQWVSALKLDELESYSMRGDTAMRTPASSDEVKLRDMWVEILKVPATSIGLDDNFFALGGDSVTAMQLIAVAKASGVLISVAEVFQFPRLQDMAKAVKTVQTVDEQELEVIPFTLLPDSIDVSQCMEEVAKICQADLAMIDDMYPATPIQEALLVVSTYRRWAYTHQSIFEMSPDMDIDRFKVAWETVIAEQPILRTRVVNTQEAGTLQVVLHDKIQWNGGSSLEDYLEEDRDRPMTYGRELSRWAIITGKKPYFVWTIHHSMYDGWSLSRIFDDVKRVYQTGTKNKIVPYGRFIKYLTRLEKQQADDFWCRQFPGYTDMYPSLPASDYKPVAQSMRSSRISIQQKRNIDVTMPSLVKAAWALLMSKYTGENRALFGLTLSGRDVPVDGVVDILGPTLTTVPLRVPIDGSLSVAKFLQKVQEQVTQIRRYQHTGLQHIRRLSREASAAVEFQNLLVIQNVGDEEIRSSLSDLGLKQIDHEEKDFFNLSMTLECIVRHESVQANLRYDENVISHLQSQHLLHQLGHTILTLMAEQNQQIPLSEVDLVSDEELQQLSIWNDEVNRDVISTGSTLSRYRSWVVEVGNPDRLVPIGCLGELVIEKLSDSDLGPEMQSEQEVSIVNLAWSQSKIPSRGRTYRTNQLARIYADGRVGQFGLIDDQIKIRGRRVERETIANTLRENLPPGSEVVVDAWSSETNPSEKTLIAFVSLVDFRQPNGISVRDSQFDNTTVLQRIFPKLEDTLADIMPEHLIPTVYVPITKFPTTPVGKIDRNALKQYAQNLPPNAKLARNLSSKKQQPTTEMERLLQTIWSRVLGHPDVGVNDTFTSLGGDSIHAMQIVTACRKASIRVSVSTILSKKTIVALAPLCVHDTEDVQASYPHPEKVCHDMEAHVKQALLDLNIDVENVEASFSCTAMQEGIILSQQKGQDVYRVSSIWEIFQNTTTGNVDFSQIAKAWQSLIARHSAMRTGIVEDTKNPGHFIQVVLKQPPTRIVESKQVLSELTEAADVSPPEERSFWSHLPHLMTFRLRTGAFACRMDIGHTMVDAASMDILINEFVDLLVGKQPSTPKSDYEGFVQYEKSLSREDALSYWARYLSETQPCHLPSQDEGKTTLTKYGFYTVAKSVTNKMNDFCKQVSITPAALIQTAWSILLGSFTNKSDICFGYLVSDRDAPIDGIENHIGLYISMQVCHMVLQGSVKDVLYRVQDDIIEGFKHRHCSLAAIQNVLGLREVALFNTCVTVVRAVSDEVASQASSVVKMLDLPQKSEYVVSLNASVGLSDVDVTFSYQLDHIPETYAKSIGGSLEAILDSIMNSADQSIDAVNLISQRDLRMLQEWNSDVPFVDATVRDLIDRQVIATPDAIAISSYEGQWTYSELNESAQSLAEYFMSDNLALGPEVPVMLCFKKSAWAIISRLAVFKTGSYFVPINPDDPTARLIDLCTTTGSSIVLCDTENEHRFSTNLRSIVIDQTLLERCATENTTNHGRMESVPHYQTTNTSKVTPDNTAMVLFTSGSTGKPKGVILQHRALATALTIHTKGLSINSNSRVLQFVAYTFDVSIVEIFGPLIRGGCICVISEDERMNRLSQAINERAATWCFMTPSVLKLLSPLDTPTLKIVTYGGETGTKRMIQDWCNHVTLVNVYGPTEASIFSTYNFNNFTTDPENIGHAAGCKVWITQLENSDRLLPIGCVGELLIEGPGLARGYLGNAQADKAFITNPKWSRSGKMRRFYRTGDLARYNADRTITFLGRADAQIKINGRRVELSEIEYQIQQCLQSTSQVTAEVVRYHESSEPSLTAFIKLESAKVIPDISSADSAGSVKINTPESKPDSILDRNRMKELQSMLPNLTRQLNEVLPQYMVPTIYVPVISMPSTTSGKTDRAKLRSFAQCLSQDEMCIPGINIDKCQPENETEVTLQLMWADILNVPHQTIGIDDAFTSIGGDSITAIRAVSEFRKNDINISVAHIFRHKTIRSIAKVIRQDPERPNGSHFEAEAPSNERPYQNVLYPDLDGLLSKVSEDDVQDILPLAPFQTISVEGNMDNPPKHWTFLLINLPDTAEAGRVKATCQAMMREFDILRTIFVKTKNGDLMQVFLKTCEVSFTISEAEDDLSAKTEAICRNDLELDRFLGKSFVDFTFIGTPSAKRLIMRLSHAQFDGFNCSTLVQTFSALYEGEPVSQTPSYSKFVRHVIEHNYQGYDYWRLLLEDSLFTTVPQITQQALRFKDPSVIRVNREVSGIVSRSGATSATIFTAACSLLLSSLTGSRDVLFGRLVSGRTSLPENLASTVGPCLNIIPVRTHFQPNQSMKDILAAAQNQSIESSAHETIGLSEILQHCLSQSTTETHRWPLDATGKPYFPVISQYTNVDAAPIVDQSNQHFELSVWDSTLVHPFPQSLCLSGTPNENTLTISVSAGAEWCTSKDMAFICDELCHILERFANDE